MQLSRFVLVFAGLLQSRGLQKRGAKQRRQSGDESPHFKDGKSRAEALSLCLPGYQDVVRWHHPQAPAPGPLPITICVTFDGRHFRHKPLLINKWFAIQLPSNSTHFETGICPGASPAASVGGVRDIEEAVHSASPHGFRPVISRFSENVFSSRNGVVSIWSVVAGAEDLRLAIHWPASKQCARWASGL